MSVSAIELTPANAATATPAQRRTMLHEAVNEVVGTIFYGEMLRLSRANPFKGRYGHGGRGEEIFGAQLDLELARRAGQASSGGLQEALYRHLEKGL